MCIVLIRTGSGVLFYNGYKSVSMWDEREFNASRMVQSVAEAIASQYPGAEVHRLY